MRTPTGHPTFPQYLPYALLAALACSAASQAANITDTWNPALATDNWSNAANWSAGLPGTDPNSLYDIQIQSASTSQSILYDLPTSPTNLNSLTIDATNNHTATFSITDNNTLIIQNTETIGLNGNATFIQTAGTNSVGVLLLASNHGSNATYTLGDTLGSNPTLIAKTSEEIGGSGNATFTQYSGNNNAINLFVGFSASATYNLAGGNLTLAGGLFLGDYVSPVSANFLQTGGNLTVNAGYGYPEFVGYNTSGNFTQLAGNHTIASDLNVGFNYSTPSTSLPSIYILGDTTGDSPTLSIAGNLTIGNNSNGTFTQYSGNLTTAGLFLAKGANSKATFTLNGGNLTITTSPLSIAQDYNTTATFIQNGGTLTLVSAPLILGNILSSSTSSYTQTGGNIFANGADSSGVSEYIGYNANSIFTQTGGNNTAAHDLFVGPGYGTYILGNTTGANPTLNVLGSERINSSVAIPFIQYSGNNFAGNLYLGDYNAGSYTLNGGNLTITTGSLYLGSRSPNFPYTNFLQNAGNITASTDSEYIGYNGSGNFSQINGTNTIAANLYVSYTDSNTTGHGSYTLGNTTGASPSLTVAGTEYIGYSTSFQVTGTFTQYSGNNTTSVLILGGGQFSGSGNYSLLGGNLFANGADLNGVSEYIGFAYQGNFTHTGGTNTVSHDLFIGPSSGTYILGNTTGANPTLTVLGSERIGTSSVTAFLQYSGNNTTASLYVGNQFAGNYTLNGGNLTITTGNLYIGAQYPSLSNTLTQNAGNVTSTNSQYIGYQGYGNYTQYGGNNTIAANLYVTFADANPNAVGNYTLGNNTGASPSLTVSGTEYIGYATTFQVTGTFTQYSGNNTTGSLTLGGGFLGASGNYSLISGNLTLTSGPLAIANCLASSSTFTQSGGNVSLVSDLLIAPTGSAIGSYSINNPTASLNILGNTYLGGTAATSGGQATFNLSSGNVSIAGTLKIWPQNNSIFNLSGGSLSVGALDLSNTPSLLHWTSGNLTINNSTTFDPFGNATTSKAFGPSLTLNANQSLQITGNETLGGTAPFSLTLNNGSSHIVTGWLVINPTASLTLNPGSSLSYSILFQFGGTLTGTLLNQSTFDYESGNFTGPLINLGRAYLNSDTGSSTTSPLSIISTGTTYIFGPQHLNSLSIQDGITQLFNGTTKTNNFSLAGSTNAWIGLLDLTSASLIIEDAANHNTTLANLQNQITFDPSHTVGITSSTLKPNQAIVVVDNAIAQLSTFGGNPIDAASILLTPAYKGDFNLDGVVDIQDLTTIANHWQQPVADYSQGDFDNNKIVDIQDLTAVANNWQTGVTSAITQSIPLLPSISASSTSSPTPEPASLSLLFISAAPLLLKRKH